MMRTIIAAMVGSVLLAGGIANAGDTANKAGGDAVKTEAATKKSEPQGGTMTKELGAEVPTMTSDEKPAAEATAPDSQTYTGKVGEAVPEMTGDDKNKKPKSETN